MEQVICLPIKSCMLLFQCYNCQVIISWSWNFLFLFHMPILHMFHALTGCDTVTVSIFVGHSTETTLRYEIHVHSMYTARAGIRDFITKYMDVIDILIYDHRSTFTDVTRPGRSSLQRHTIYAGNFTNTYFWSSMSRELHSKVVVCEVKYLSQIQCFSL